MNTVRLAAGLLCLVVLAISDVGCNSGGGGKPPTAPPMPPHLAEQYSGSATFNSATPAQHCLAAGLPHVFHYSLTLAQTGGALSGVLAGTDFSQSCEMQGSVSSAGSISLSQTSCSPRCFAIALGSSACFVKVCAEGATLTGVATARSIAGQLVIDWSTSDNTTGADLGPVRIAATIDLQAP
jgi:hypothetical protein